MQRTGTTSVGKFLRDFGYRTAGWNEDYQNDWSGHWYDGEYEEIFSSVDFRTANAFEDSPWWMPGFYRVVFNRFPSSKFILFTRNPDAWFRSMLSHSNGNIIGGSQVHCRIYRRELEYYDLLKTGQIVEHTDNQVYSKKTMKITVEHAEHYKAAYRLHNEEVQDFFARNSPISLHVGELEDPDKWEKLGRFLGFEIPPGYDSHENATPS